MITTQLTYAPSTSSRTIFLGTTRSARPKQGPREVEEEEEEEEARRRIQYTIVCSKSSGPAVDS